MASGCRTTVTKPLEKHKMAVGRGKVGAVGEGIVWGVYLQACFQAGAQGLFSEQGSWKMDRVLHLTYCVTAE